MEWVHDPADHATALLRLLGDVGEAARMGREGARQALRFTWDATADEVLNTYRELMAAS